MGGRQGDGAIEVARPVALQLHGQGEDQIERDIGDARLSQRLDGLTDAGRIVGAMHPLQRTIRERLGAEGDAIDAGGAPGGRVLDRHVVGVGFQRDFNGVAGQRRGKNVAEDYCNRCGREE